MLLYFELLCVGCQKSMALLSREVQSTQDVKGEIMKPTCSNPWVGAWCFLVCCHSYLQQLEQNSWSLPFMCFMNYAPLPEVQEGCQGLALPHAHLSRILGLKGGKTMCLPSLPAQSLPRRSVFIFQVKVCSYSLQTQPPFGAPLFLRVHTPPVWWDPLWSLEKGKACAGSSRAWRLSQQGTPKPWLCEHDLEVGALSGGKTPQPVGS